MKSCELKRGKLQLGCDTSLKFVIGQRNNWHNTQKRTSFNVHTHTHTRTYIKHHEALAKWKPPSRATQFSASDAKLMRPKVCYEKSASHLALLMLLLLLHLES